MPGFELDRIDAKIIDMMIRDARSSLKEMADATGVTPNSIFKRLEKLRSKGIIVGTTVIFNPNLLGQVSAVNVELKVDRSEVDQIITNLGRRQNVLVCLECIGRCNVYALVCVHHINQLDSMIEDIRGLPGVLKVSVSGKIYETEMMSQNVELMSAEER